MKLDSVRAVVTGAAGGLGRIFCKYGALIRAPDGRFSDWRSFFRKLLENGASVVATDFDPTQLAQVQSA